MKIKFSLCGMYDQKSSSPGFKVKFVYMPCERGLSKFQEDPPTKLIILVITIPLVLVLIIHDVVLHKTSFNTINEHGVKL